MKKSTIAILVVILLLLGVFGVLISPALFSGEEISVKRSRNEHRASFPVSTAYTASVNDDNGKSMLPEEEVIEEDVAAEEMPEEEGPHEPTAEELAAMEEEARILRETGFDQVMADSTSTSAILIRYRDDEYGGVVAVKNGDEQLAPASMTKLMTVLLLAENAKDLNDVMTMPEGIFDYFLQVDASTAGYWGGSTLTVEDCLYGILLPSGCDCCEAAAYYLAGSDEAFADMMNQKAEELGMTNTHYITAHGLYVEGHVTTANDMAKLAQACWENELVRQVITSTGHGSSDGDLYWTNKLLIDLSTGFDESIHILGGKTGYSRYVGQNLTTFAEVNGETYILVTIGAPGSPYNGDLEHHDDHRRIYNALAQAYKEGRIIVPEPVEAVLEDPEETSTITEDSTMETEESESVTEENSVETEESSAEESESSSETNE